MWAAGLPDFLTQDKEHLLKEKAKLRTLLKRVPMDQFGHTHTRRVDQCCVRNIISKLIVPPKIILNPFYRIKKKKLK